MPETRKVYKQISAADTFTDVLSVQGDKFSISVYLSAAAWGTTIITLQKRHADFDTWRDVQTFTADFEGIGDNGDNAEYRIGIKLGEYNTGTFQLRLGAGF